MSKHLPTAIAELRKVEALLKEGGTPTLVLRQEASRGQAMLRVIDPLFRYRLTGPLHKIVDYRRTEPYTTEIRDEHGVREVTHNTIAVTRLDPTTTYAAFSDADKRLSNLCETGMSLLGSIIRGVIEDVDSGALTRLIADLEQWDPSISTGESVPAESEQSKAPAGMTWTEARDRLERKRNQGEPYTSQRRLAQQIGTTLSTVNKAFRHSPKLAAWKGEAERGCAAKKATAVSPVVLYTQAQSTEPDPAEQADRDAKLEQLMDEQKADYEPSPLEEGSTTPRQHKRA